MNSEVQNECILLRCDCEQSNSVKMGNAVRWAHKSGSCSELNMRRILKGKVLIGCGAICSTGKQLMILGLLLQPDHVEGIYLGSAVGV